MSGVGERSEFGTNSKHRDAADFYSELHEADEHDKVLARAMRELALSGRILLIVSRQPVEETEEGSPGTLLRIVNEEEVA